MALIATRLRALKDSKNLTVAELARIVTFAPLCGCFFLLLSG